MLLPSYPRIKWGLVLCLSAASVGCQAPPETPKSNFDCPEKVSRALAFSHLKEAHVSMEVLTVEAARKAIALSTDGLSCAPPRGHAQAATVARLLVERAGAYASLEENAAALADLEAALLWAEQGKKDDPLLVPEIHLARARLFLLEQEHARAAESAAFARDSAAKLGEPGAGLQCEALVLEGDLAGRRPSAGYPPEGYFLQVFQVAKTYHYPESVWDYVERAAFRLQSLDAKKRHEILAPVVALRERKRKDEEEQRLMSARTRERNTDIVSLASGSIAGAEQTVASLRAGFRDCFRRHADSGPGGQAMLTISVGSNGAVEHVEADSHDMSPATLECLIQTARSAQFNPPSTEHAVLNVPVTFIKQ